MLQAYQSLRARYHAMLDVEIPRCWEVRNDFCGGDGTTVLNHRIRFAVILKSDADELRASVQLNRRLAQLRVYRSQ